jgi:hypothetical protein
MNRLAEEIREALKPHRVEGFTAVCYPMPTLQQVEQLITEIGRLTAERDRYKVVLERLANAVSSSSPLQLVILGDLNAAAEYEKRVDEALATVAQPETTCESCHDPLGDDAPLYEDADICRKCHNEIQAAEAVQPPSKDCGCGMGAECMRSAEAVRG